jgi:hypothetical protein
MDHPDRFRSIFIDSILALRQFEIQIETEVEVDQVVHQAEHELLLDLEERPDDENMNQARTTPCYLEWRPTEITAGFDTPILSNPPTPVAFKIV